MQGAIMLNLFAQRAADTRRMFRAKHILDAAHAKLEARWVHRRNLNGVIKRITAVHFNVAD